MSSDEFTALPPPRRDGEMSVEEAIATRRSFRSFAEHDLTLGHISQLCWAGVGITDAKEGRRASPSAGALNPLELYVAAASGVHLYRPGGHVLEQHLVVDVRGELQKAAYDQEVITAAPLSVIIAAVVERTASKYRLRAERYCLIEAGHAAQNILIQATALGLVGVPVGAFEDERVNRVLEMPPGCRALYMVPIGHPAGPAG